jgi:hypothetical protein
LRHVIVEYVCCLPLERHYVIPTQIVWILVNLWEFVGEVMLGDIAAGREIPRNLWDHPH